VDDAPPLGRDTNESSRVAVVREPPIVSIVTPSFNAARFLPETIESVLGQDYPRIEYLVMDGGSRDGTVELLQRYEGRLRWVSEPDGGQAEAINRGFELTSGELFAFLNADDTYLSGAVGRAVEHLMAHREAGMIYGEAWYVDEFGERIERYPTLPFDHDQLARSCFVCQPAAFMRRAALADAGLFNTDYDIALDYELWMRMAKLFPIVHVGDYLATARMHRANKSVSRKGELLREAIRANNEQRGYVPFGWVLGYSCYLLTRRDDFFNAARPGPLSYALSLGLGAWYNPRQLRRYWRDWARPREAARHLVEHLR
jgi:glycosyltransferase involved in cell wall biosynthesis